MVVFLLMTFWTNVCVFDLAYDICTHVSFKVVFVFRFILRDLCGLYSKFLVFVEFFVKDLYTSHLLEEFESTFILQLKKRFRLYRHGFGVDNFHRRFTSSQ